MRYDIANKTQVSHHFMNTYKNYNFTLFSADLTEPYPLLNALVPVLSTGPVGPSDAVGFTDKDLLMK